jgi:2-polyprenyl-3-methyl-5-hydroxy-6-metoxy-1,4-benzoquinol methylase
MAVPADEAQETTAEFWGRPDVLAGKSKWSTHPVIRAYMNRRVSGDEAVTWIKHLKRTYFTTPVPLGLSVGCGHGRFELDALRAGLAERIEAFDLSPQAIEIARTQAEQAGLSGRATFRQSDANTDELGPAGALGAIFGVGSFHHVEKLETLARNCWNALQPGGLLVLNEYIGPSRWQLPQAQRELINQVIALLPEHLRRVPDGTAKRKYKHRPLSWFERVEPSESIRSAEVLPVMSYYFDVVEFKPYGGGLLRHALNGIAHNFDPASSEHTALLKSIALLEEQLERAEVLKPESALVVLRRKDTY